MKKILSLLTAAAMVFSLSATVFAEASENREAPDAELTEAFVQDMKARFGTEDYSFDYVRGLVGDDNGAWLFYDEINDHQAVNETQKKAVDLYERRIGEYVFESKWVKAPYELGVYVYKDSKVYTLEEANEQSVISMDNAVSIIKSNRNIVYSFRIEGNCEDAVKALREKYNTNDMFDLVKLGEYQNAWLCYDDRMNVAFRQQDKKIGDFIFKLNDIHPYYDLGLYVYKDGKAYTLEEACKDNIFSIDFAVELINYYGTAKFTFGIESENEDVVKAFRKRYGIPETSVFKFVKLGEDGASALYFNDTELVQFLDYDVSIGAWTFDCYSQQKYYDLGLYVYNDGSIYTLAEAYDKNLFSIDKAVECIKATDGQHFTFSIKGKAEQPKLSKNKLTLKSGAEKVLTVKNGEVKSWKTSDKKVATVKNGKITALNKGTAKITPVLKSGEKLTCKVSVSTAPKLGKTSVKVNKNGTVKIKLTGKAKSVNNKYTNTKYAKFTSAPNADTLIIKGVKKGTSTLKVKVNGAVTLKINVTVK